MATDIAFALGVLSLLGSRVPTSAKVFLTALAIIDDLGAIIVIAVGYSSSLSLLNLSIALLIILALFACNRLGVRSVAVYLVAGLFLWHFVHASGIHATITGVLLAFLIPFGKGGGTSPSHIVQHWLHYPVAFLVLPLFALANTALPIQQGWHAALLQPNSLGIMLGLVLGKPIGITLLSMLGVWTKALVLPQGLTWRHVVAISILGGVGFTMSIFISLLAFQDPVFVQQSKIAILVSSAIAGVVGYLVIRRVISRSDIPAG